MKTKTKTDRPGVILIHFRKAGVKTNRPWTVHFKGQCIPASHVLFGGYGSQTVFRPDKKTNPRAWIRTYGKVMVGAGGRVVIYS